MIISAPKRPSGQGPDAAFMQWVYETLNFILRQQEADGSLVNRTSRGFYTLPQKDKLSSVEFEVCEEDGSTATYILYGFKKRKPPDVTADSTTKTADTDELTADS